jgi:hypothetical protein
MHPPEPKSPPLLDAEDTVVDFSNASLYVAGIQTVFSICACACVSVLSCWLAPVGGVSAVRTLALCSATGAALMYRPLRLGPAHGVTAVFASLQLAVPLYLITLIVAQLVHTCTSDPSHAPSWRHVIFHAAVSAMICSGFMRARAPLAETDRPFVLTLSALLIIAIMPPPAVALVGPLCEAVTLWDAADRLVRAFVFATLYCVNVYASTSASRSRTSDTSVIFFRSASASIWVAGALVWWLPLATAQAAIVIHSRVSHNPGADDENGKDYRRVNSTASTDDEEDAEMGHKVNNDPVAEQERLLKNRPSYLEDVVLGKIVPTSALPPPPPPPPPTDRLGPLVFQSVVLDTAGTDSVPDAFSASVAKAMAECE